MSTDSVLSHEEILKELERLHRDKRTGTARVATSDNQLFQVAFNNGEIVAATMGLKHNLEAIQLFSSSTRTGRLKFSEGKPRAAETNGLPPTAGTLRMLGLTQTLASSIRPAGQPGTAVSIIEREAVDFLGPMASIIWEEQLTKVGDITRPGAVQKLIDSLAKEIGGSGDANKARLFKTTIEKKLAAK